MDESIDLNINTFYPLFKSDLSMKFSRYIAIECFVCNPQR